MRTPAQASRDAALRRLTRVNRTLAIAAVVGTGVITDAVANTASGHTRTVAASTSGADTGKQPAATVTKAQTRHHTARRAVHHSAATSSGTAATSSGTAATSSGTAATSTPSVSSAQSTAVVAVSGGS
ncbi:MAG: hypothetical protein KGL15_02725 [Acidobacteriota bacterium]|nr:hypothetical protein [Acidobacteriota bacterium]